MSTYAFYYLGITSVRVTLQCIGVGCTFGKEAVLRGVNFDGHVEREDNGSSLVFNLPTPGHHIATHYYLQVRGKSRME